MTQTGFVLLVPAALSLIMGQRCVVLFRRARLADTRFRAAQEGEAFVTRALQLFAHELQAMALTLRGHADQLTAELHPNAPGIAAAAAQLGSLADELGHHLTPAGTSRVLACEDVALFELIQETVALMEAAIHPGRRHWRLLPAAEPITINVDLRAFRLVLMRVLGEAVRSSAHGDWIEIGWGATAPATATATAGAGATASTDGVVIRIEDEGAGTVLPGAAGARIDSRGIGLRLALARTLVAAHGGTLAVEAQAQVGTRVTIALPADRLRNPRPAGGAIRAPQHILADT